MIVLLDTHILLWWFNDDRALSRSARKIITETDDVYVSAATAWEIAIKHAINKLRFTADLEREIETNGFTSLDITVTASYQNDRFGKEAGGGSVFISEVAPDLTAGRKFWSCSGCHKKTG